MNDIVKNNPVTTTDNGSKAPEEMLVDPQAYEQFLAAFTQGMEKLNTQLTDGLQDKRENTELMRNMQQEINLVTRQINDYLAQPQSADAGFTPPVIDTDNLQSLLTQIFPDLEISINPLKAMQDKLNETNNQLKNNLITKEDAQSVLQETQQLLNNSKNQIDNLLKKIMAPSVNSQPMVSSSTPSTTVDGELLADHENETPPATSTSSPQANSSSESSSSVPLSATSSSSSTSVAGISYNSDLSALSDIYSLFVLIGLLCIEVSKVVSDSGALNAQLLSMNTEYADRLNDDMMAYVSMLSFVPYEYTDANGEKQKTDDPYLIYSIICISTPGNAAYDPESAYFDQELAQKGAGFYTYMQENCPDIAIYDPDEISKALSLYDNELTLGVSEAYSDMAQAMEALNNDIKDCGTHLQANSPVVDFPETEVDIPNTTIKCTKLSLSTTALNTNQSTITEDQTQADQISQTLTEEIKTILQSLSDWLKEANTAFEKQGSVSNSIITGQ